MGEFKSPETVEAETMLAKAVAIMKADGNVDERTAHSPSSNTVNELNDYHEHS